MPALPVPVDRRQHLLLLPPPPSPPTYEALKAAYHASLYTVLTEIARSPDRPAVAAAGGLAGTTSLAASAAPDVLDIALPCEHLYQSRRKGLPQSLTFQKTQRLVAGLYKLVCVISAKAGLPLEHDGGVDARILLLAYPRSGKPEPSPSGSPQADTEGPVVDIATLATCPRPWRTVYYVESEAGQQIYNNFRAASGQSRQGGQSYKKVRGGIVQVSSKEEEDLSALEGAKQAKKHHAVAVGGTFDHLHIGHKLLLTMTAFTMDKPDAESAEQEKRRLTIGITGDELLKNKKFAEVLQSWSDRMKYTDDFLRSILDFSAEGSGRVSTQERNDPGPNGHAVLVTMPSGLEIDYVEIWDPFGPTITDKSISALVISAETRAGGNAVNSKRQENNWLPLDVYEVDVLDADEEAGGDPALQQDIQTAFANKLSSTEIRRGLLERSAPRSKA